MPVPAAHVVLAVLAHIGGPMMSVPAPDQVSTPEMTISVAGNLREVSGGERIRYQIIVKNGTDAEAPVTIRLTLPAAVATGVQAEGATVVANAIAWKDMMPAKATARFSVAGNVDREVQARDLAVLACLHQGSDAPPLVCATDRTPVAAPPRTPGLTWLAAILFGLLAVVGAVWLHRRLQPEPLTPANAGSVYGQGPGQPGGAPSG